MTSPDSSMDESLQEFLDREGIKLDQIGTAKEETVNMEDILKASVGITAPRTFSKSEEEAIINPASFDMTDIQGDMLLPSISKISDILRSHGFLVSKLTHNEIDIDQKVSVGDVDSWAESVVPCVMEIFERLDTKSSDLIDASLSQRKSAVSHEALEANLRELQERLLLSERRAKDLELKLHKQGSVMKEQGAQKKGVDADFKKTVRGLEDKCKESERRVRQKDGEIERLKQKLVSIAKKEKEVAERHRHTLDQLRSGGVDLSVSSSSSTSGSPNASFSSARSGHSHSGKSHGRGRGSGSGKGAAGLAAASDVISALEHQRDLLEERNSELEGQVRDLADALKEAQNNSIHSHSHSSDGGGDGDGDGDERTSGTGGQEEGEVGLGSIEHSASARAMYEKIQHQSRAIAKLEHRCEVFKVSEEDSAVLVAQLRTRNEELREAAENLRLELEVRPSAKQWADKQREVRAAEDKLHDLVMMRGEAAELEAWRKHMSVSERIKIDKRNHELGLWVLDSLPSTVTKEVLQAVCRELEVSDVSEVAPSIQKLKAVVKAVPRMERFISGVCSYLFERDPQMVSLKGRGLDGRMQPSMEDVLPILQGWWGSLTRVERLATFQDKVCAELHRRELLLSAQIGASASASAAAAVDATAGTGAGTGTGGDEYTFGPGQRFKWSEQELGTAVETIRECVNFEAAVMRGKQSYRAADEFVRAHPEEVVSKHLKHLLYLFDIKSLEGLIPRMNAVYVSLEQSNNFLNACRGALGMKGAPDATVMTEVQRLAVMVAAAAGGDKAQAQAQAQAQALKENVDNN